MNKVKCMVCGKEYEVPCYEAQFHEHNLWELIGGNPTMKLWTDASKKNLCYAFETGEAIVLPMPDRDVPVNEAEYLALVAALQDCRNRKISVVDVHTDSQVLAFQLTGRYKCKAANLKPLRNECYRLLMQFDRWSITWISREINTAGIILDSLDKAVPRKETA